MRSVLEKTVASLEAALKHNPENIELMSSLADGYVRLAKLDAGTLSLCEKVLAKYPENSLLQLAQATAFVIEQTKQIEAKALFKEIQQLETDLAESTLDNDRD